MNIISLLTHYSRDLNFYKAYYFEVHFNLPLSLFSGTMLYHFYSLISWTILPGPIIFYSSAASAASDIYHVWVVLVTKTKSWCINDVIFNKSSKNLFSWYKILSNVKSFTDKLIFWFKIQFTLPAAFVLWHTLYSFYLHKPLRRWAGEYEVCRRNDPKKIKGHRPLALDRSHHPLD